MHTDADRTPVPVKRSVALVIRQGSRMLIVQRPPDDEDLPNTWGLPAGSLHPGEAWTDAVERAAREKLGLEVAAGSVLNEGRVTRRAYVLHMRLYEAEVTGGEPRVDQPERGVTRYVGWRWGQRSELVPAAERGSLCSRLLLETE